MAAALTYGQGDRAPRVVAKGLGHVADRIVATAAASGVPIEVDPALAGGLLAVELGREIPPELYEAVATVLAFLYRLEQDQAAVAGGEAGEGARPGAWDRDRHHRG